MELITELFDYQQAAVEKLMNVKVGALYMEMGTGKTRTALELIKRRLDSGKIKQILWLCPFSVQRDLPELLAEHVKGIDDIIRIAGIESLSSSARLNSELRAYVKKKPTFLVVDESLLAKNPFAYRTQNVCILAKFCEYKLILNGTPISRNEADLFAQWYILDWRILGYQSYYSFAANHLEMDEEHPDKVRRVLNKDYLARKIAPYTFECQKSDVLELPPKSSMCKAFSLTSEQDEHYADISNKLLLEVNEFRPETIYRLFGALQAITSGFVVQLSDDEKHCSLLRMYAPIDNPRIKTLLKILNEIGEEQAIIYCHYTQEISDICEVLGERSTPFYGEMTQAMRQASKDKFKRGDAQYFVANKSCAQFGLNLQFCRNEIFYNNDWDWGTRAQAEDRVHRAGQTKEVRLWDIYAYQTLDATILDCLSRKERLSDIFKQKVASHNDTYNLVRAAIRGHIDLEGTDGKDLSKH